MCENCGSHEYLFFCEGCGMFLCAECYGEENASTPFSICASCDEHFEEEEDGKTD